MAIKVVCDICGEQHKVREDKSGSRMHCKACDHTVKVPRGPRIPDDAELVEDEEDDNGSNEEEDEGNDFFPMAKSIVGAVFGLIVMGFYVTFTVKYLTGAEGASPIRTGNRRGSNGSFGVAAPTPRVNRNRVPNNPRNTTIPGMPSFPGVTNPSQPDIPSPFTPNTRPTRPTTRPTFPRPGLPGMTDPSRPGQPNFPARPGLPRTFPSRPTIPDRTRPGRPTIPLPGSPTTSVDDPSKPDDSKFDDPSNDKIQVLAASPTDGVVATGTLGGKVRVWKGGRPFSNYGHSGPVLQVRFTPDGTRLLSVGKDKTFRVWGRRNGVFPSQLPVPNLGHNSKIACSPSGRLAAVSTNNGKVVVVDVVDREVKATLEADNHEEPYDFVGEDRLLMLAASGSWKFVEVGGREIRSGKLPHQGTVAAAASRQGLLALTVAGSKQIFLVNAETGVGRTPIPVDESAYTMRFSPDGAFLAVIEHGRKVRAYDVTADPAVRVFEADNVHIGVGFTRWNGLVYAQFNQAKPGQPLVQTQKMPDPKTAVAAYEPPDSLPTGSKAPVATGVATGVTTKPFPAAGGALKTDPSQPIVITQLSPTNVAAGGQLTIRGKGFSKATALAFASWRTRADPEMAVRDFEVVSDTEIRVTVPAIVSKQRGGSIVEVHTPEGVGVTWPADSLVLSQPSDRPKPFGFVVVARDLASDVLPMSTNVLVEPNARIKGLLSTRAYVRAGAQVGSSGLSNGIIASKRSTVEAKFEAATSVNAAAIYPSYLPRILNQ